MTDKTQNLNSDKTETQAGKLRWSVIRDNIAKARETQRSVQFAQKGIDQECAEDVTSSETRFDESKTELPIENNPASQFFVALNDLHTRWFEDSLGEFYREWAIQENIAGRKIILSRLKFEAPEFHRLAEERGALPDLSGIAEPEELYQNRINDETPIEWLAQHYSPCLRFYTPHLEHDHLYQDELKDMDPYLLSRLKSGKQHQLLAESGRKLADLVPPKSARVRIEASNLSLDQLRGVRRLDKAIRRHSNNTLDA